MKKIGFKQLTVLGASLFILVGLFTLLSSQIDSGEGIVQSIISILVVSVLTFFYFLSILKEIKQTPNRTHSERIVDDLTALPNRAQLLADLDGLKKNASLSLINIDDFHSVNDYYGTSIGDELLIEFADWLKDYLKDEPIRLYHLSADEFALLSLDLQLESGRAKECIESIEQKIFLQMQAIDLNIYVSAGLASGREKLLQKADIALKTAKESELEMLVYDDFLSKRDYKSKLLIGKKLKSAVSDDRIVPYYQKIVSRDGTTVMYEALMRMVDDDGLIVAPMKFLAIAKETKLNTKMTKMLMRKSFEHFEPLNEKISINLFASDVASSELTQFIAKLLSEYSLNNRVMFDVVEMNSAEDYEALGRFKEILSAYNVEVAIENFGVGYTDFVNAARIGVDYIKIDRSLTQEINSSEYAKAAISSIATYCKSAGIKTIAKQVSTQEIATSLEELNIDFMQGYYFGQPAITVS